MFFSLATMICIGVLTHGSKRREIYHRRRAVIDPLTGLLNRSSLAQRFYELREQALITGQPMSAVVCDLDHFERINDNIHGHTVGDDVLTDVAYTLLRILCSGERSYRIGGEEFAILLPGLTASD